MHNKCGPWTFIRLCALIHAKHNILQFIHLQASAEAVRLYNLQRIHTESLFLPSSQTSSARGCALVENHLLMVSFEPGSLSMKKPTEPCICLFCIPRSKSGPVHSPCTDSVGKGRKKFSTVFLCHLSGNSRDFLNPPSYLRSQCICIIHVESRVGTEHLQVICLKINVLTLLCLV